MPMCAPSLVTCSDCELRLIMPVDPLTRLMMDADNISVSEMEALIQQVSRSLAKRLGEGGEFTN
jgi:hypothetical protein